MKMMLNVITGISLVVATLTACMVDSPSMIPAYICAGSVAVLGLSCFVREKLC